MISFTQTTNFFGNTNPMELANRYGTPLYVYNENILRRQMRNVANLIPIPNFTANYSIKTNSNLSILRLAMDEGLSADAMSPGEIYVLLKAGFPKERIFYVSNNVSAEELQYAIDQGIMTSLDSLSQLDLYGQLNPGGRCAVRLNPGVGAGHHEKVITGGKKTKFAIAESDVPEIAQIAARHNLKIVGVNQHIGSLFMDGTPFITAVEHFLQLALRFPDLEFADFGGGFGIPYHKLSGEKEFDLASFGKDIEKAVADFTSKYGRSIVFKCEPGRYVAAEGGVLLGRVHCVTSGVGEQAALDGLAGEAEGADLALALELGQGLVDAAVVEDGQVVAVGMHQDQFNMLGFQALEAAFYRQPGMGRREVEERGTVDELFTNLADDHPMLALTA